MRVNSEMGKWFSGLHRGRGGSTCVVDEPVAAGVGLADHLVDLRVRVAQAQLMDTLLELGATDLAVAVAVKLREGLFHLSLRQLLGIQSIQLADERHEFVQVHRSALWKTRFNAIQTEQRTDSSFLIILN